MSRRRRAGVGLRPGLAFGFVAPLLQVLRALEAGADEYVMKPFTTDSIFEKLQLLGLDP